MTKPNIHKKIGIIGGGQLGQMMILEAKKMGFYIIVLDPTLHCPAHSIVDEHIIANFDDEDAIRELAEESDVVTYEFEHINAHVLKQLENEGKKIYPTAASLEIIQNKFTQKTLLLKHNIPVPEFMSVSSPDDIAQAGKKYGFPMLLKSCTGGYDGKGNYVVKDINDCENGYNALGNGKLPLMAEKFFPFTKEISVLACRAIDGDIKVYPVAENIHHDNILDETKVPAAISESTTKRAMELAKKVMEVFEGVGMFCVEMFVDKDGNVAINEVAPRPHNSGHYTIEACVTSQFEQHIRAVSGLPLGDPSLIRPVVMRNILGEEGSTGKAVVYGADEALKIPGVTLHIYGKEISKPKRKMGHLTATAATLEEAEKNAALAKSFVKIMGK
ncbi:MAG: 5-(carboxyamino)imidazole ribonucleotide synthase [Clostridia bacterium]|jgi:5-(carboxyamino)imidazole ribonucleotide synthase|nr:5-(carboxyamino)imidazole ribonucleotide synthase [Clostridia bacterium]MCI1999841.1 5-(carboxyamino)imidazole ribonucleotide synthase [Clostridia bacterium]MCI2014243.1 5-(carboxyamino)imidazole ribonucleotide synthase [Clostridia bacterium]